MFSVTRQTIYYIIHETQNGNRVEPEPATGRRIKTPHITERILIRKRKKFSEISTRVLSNELGNQSGLSVSYENIRRTLNTRKYTTRFAGKYTAL